jgi:hypothetical protein
VREFRQKTHIQHCHLEACGKRERSTAGKKASPRFRSSGFTASVMKAVRMQSQAPPPIPFPWKSTLRGMAAAVRSLAWIILACAAAFSSTGAGEALVLSIPPAIQPLWHTASWVLTALLTTVVSLLFSWRFVSRIA